MQGPRTSRDRGLHSISARFDLGRRALFPNRYEELRSFVSACTSGGATPPAVSLADGSAAVMMGVAAHRSIERGGAPVQWDEMLAEFAAHREKRDTL